MIIRLKSVRVAVVLQHRCLGRLMVVRSGVVMVVVSWWLIGMRVDDLPLRIVYASMKHFKQSPKHGFAAVSERSVIFYEISDVCGSCLSLMDEIDLERKLGV